MAKFLDTTGVSYHLEQIIKNAGDKLILISPYIKISDRIKELLEDKNRLKIDVRLVYGKNELQPEQRNWLKSLEFVKTSFCKNLHAKCYLNEKEALVTSMNLFEFSQRTNNEMGIYISKEEDAALYADVDREAKRLIRINDKIKVSVEKHASKEESNKNSKTGFCIRCGADIKLNQEKPLCIDCYNEWKKYGNDDYEEKFCHSCGAKHNATIKKPFCLKCFKKLSPK
ncbi:PLD-like domain protein [uncultured archaeon]|nr:PLD-like domain protein [uncultured archaeon]